MSLDLAEALTIAQGAKVLNVSTRTIYRLEETGKINFYRIDGVRGVRVLRSELLATLKPAERASQADYPNLRQNAAVGE